MAKCQIFEDLSLSPLRQTIMIICHLSKTKDYLVSTENMADLSNVLFDSNDLLRTGLQPFIDPSL